MKILFDFPTNNGTVPIIDNLDGSYSFTSCMMIDDDGSGDPHDDPDFQARTSYRNEGPDGVPRWLNADIVPYFVLPPQIIRGVKGVVLGCKGQIQNLVNGLMTDAMPGDVGPHTKLGEAAIASAKRVGVPSSPTSGGVETRIIRYTFWPDVPAVIDGVTYALQPYV